MNTHFFKQTQTGKVVPMFTNSSARFYSKIGDQKKLNTTVTEPAARVSVLPVSRKRYSLDGIEGGYNGL
jgi:hypothetical protein